MRLRGVPPEDQPMTTASPAFASHAKPRAKKPRGATRKTFAAMFDGEYLEPKPGAWTRTIDKAGEVVEDGRDPRALLVASPGDQLFLFGKDIEQISLVEVVDSDENGSRYRVKERFSRQRPAAGEVFVMRRDAK
jgi:hypothetical protein